ncbi:MAG TPA: alkaline phosphatase family protein [Verrucomicrobiae bacterium]|jgi:phospholipase C|nr:alkaline phosphatase family protein [Verrucomicrobiae bacterium]
MRQLLSMCLIAIIGVGPLATPAAFASDVKTVTPIQHIVIIFGENQSFDHYFGTYPNALNPGGEPPFQPLPNTPSVNGLSNALLHNNPNLNPANGSGAANPFRLDRSQAFTQDMSHDYMPEQQASDGGAMDLFPLYTGYPGPPPNQLGKQPVLTNGLVMGYYDGNTTTALWNYAQQFAMSDNSYGTDFGPSTVGAINLISGQTNGVVKYTGGTGAYIGDGNGGLTLIGDPDPYGDVCSGSETAQMGGKNIGDLLNAAGITWGWFAGGFNLSIVNSNGTTGCNRSSSTAIITAGPQNDYVPHHTPFQYYASTANLTHARPKSVQTIGYSGDAANHNYDVNDFFAAVSAGNFPAVSFLKAIAIQDAHPGNSDPLDEQRFVVKVANFLQGRPEWANTALIVLYDDSDGWYDHQLGQIVNGSNTSADALTGAGSCGSGANALPGVNPATLHAQGRCGYGPRQPLLVISPWARHNYVDNTVTDQTSVIRFVEDNWLGGRRIGQGSYDGLANSISSLFDFTQVPSTKPYILNESTGEPVNQ